MGHKIIASVAGVLLVSLAAVGAFASQEGASTQQEEPTATDTATATATETEDTDTAETPEAEGDDSAHDGDVHGIPDDNPSKEPNDDDECEKGETAIKTTPSGNEVMVPCHAADHEQKDKNSAHAADDDGEVDDGDDGDEEDEDVEDEDEDEVEDDDAQEGDEDEDDEDDDN